jgi:putative SOS response-associated peptidase YedK
MCYTASSLTKAALKYAKHRATDQAEIQRLEQQLQLVLRDSVPLYQISGFAHPKLLTFTNIKPYQPVLMRWGFIPHWVKTEEQAEQLSNQTLNARGETIFEKPSFRVSAQRKRCVIYLDGFFEYHHLGKNSFPFFIRMQDESPMAVAGLWDTWVNPASGEVIDSLSIVTTLGNALMSRIHNNPKADEPRMPLILQKEEQDKWLHETSNEAELSQLKKIIQPYAGDDIIAYPVRKLTGKNASGNHPEATEAFQYPELNTLFDV